MRRRRDKRAVFVHGCFWHLHPRDDCLESRLPKSNAGYWHAKLLRNAERDRQHAEALLALGWRVLTVWDCQLRQPDLVRARLKEFFTGSRAALR